jgi:hypothetical protein
LAPEIGIAVMAKPKVIIVRSTVKTEEYKPTWCDALRDNSVSVVG